MIVKKSFLVEVDWKQLGDTLSSVKPVNFERYALVEAFIASFESVREVVQLLSVARMTDSSDSQDTMRFSKAVFHINDDDSFSVVREREFIEADEYYDRLLNFNSESVQSKLRLVFHHHNVEYALEYDHEHSFSILQLKFDDEVVVSPSMLAGFDVIRELDMTFEEIFYKRYVDMAL